MINKQESPGDVKTNVSKMVVVPYKDEKFEAKSKEAKPYYLPVNPETYGQNYKISVNQEQGQGNEGSDVKYVATKPEELKVEFLLDGTGTIEGYYNPEGDTVEDQFRRFRKVVYDMVGNNHRPHFLIIFWGELKFPCILTNLDINYTLFTSDGKPLRAKVAATFLRYIGQEERIATENKKSPDLTHQRVVTAGDRLDLMTHEIYNDSQYIFQVARANGLSTFRQVAPGKQLVFPPLDKTES